LARNDESLLREIEVFDMELGGHFRHKKRSQKLGSELEQKD
jgi:hypothetical protein